MVGLEGSDAPERLVIIEFDDMAALKRWYESDDVKPLNELRQQVARSRAIAFEGV